MGLQLSQRPAKERVTSITNKDDAFADTEFVHSDFKLDITPLTRGQISAIQNRHTKIKKGVERPDNAAIDAEIFCRCVVGWEGIEDENGDPVEFNDKNKRFIADEHWVFASCVNAAIINLAGENIKSEQNTLGNS